MNIQSELRRIYNEVEGIQVPDERLNRDNYSRAVYLRGVYHGFKMFLAIYNGDVIQEKVDQMLNEIISKDKVN